MIASKDYVPSEDYVATLTPGHLVVHRTSPPFTTVLEVKPLNRRPGAAAALLSEHGYYVVSRWMDNDSTSVAFVCRQAHE